jgi:hypothetical protein
MPLNLESVCIEGKRRATLDGFASGFGSSEEEEGVGQPWEDSKCRSVNLTQLPKSCEVLYTIEVVKDIFLDCSRSSPTDDAEEASTRDVPTTWWNGSTLHTLHDDDNRIATREAQIENGEESGRDAGKPDQ